MAKPGHDPSNCLTLKCLFSSSLHSGVLGRESSSGLSSGMICPHRSTVFHLCLRPAVSRGVTDWQVSQRDLVRMRTRGILLLIENYCFKAWHIAYKFLYLLCVFYLHEPILCVININNLHIIFQVFILLPHSLCPFFKNSCL